MSSAIDRVVPAWRRYAPLGFAALILVWHAQQYDFVTDDAFISFVYSRNLAEHGQLTFNLGDRVEGYTNFLWTFVLGAVMAIGVPPELAARVLGVGCGLGVLAMSFRISERALGQGHPLAGLAPILLACSSGFACWSSGGLETQLYTLLIAVAVDGYLAASAAPEPALPRAAVDARVPSDPATRGLRRMGIALALASMTRPEGPLLAALFGAHRVATNLISERRWRPSRAEWMAAAWFLGLWAPWFAWRWWYYGWPFPNTYYVKAAGAASPGYDAQMRANGWHYLGRWFTQTGLAWASPLAVLGLVARPGRTARFALVTLAAVVFAVYVRYVAGVGGDFMGLHRFIMPLFVLAALALALGVERVGALAGRLAGATDRRLALGVSLGVGAVVLGLFAHRQLALTRASLRHGNFANDRGIDTPAFLRAYTHDRALIGKALAPCVRPDDFAIYGGVGAMPYYARLRGVDVFGLVSSRVAHEVPRTRPRAGHNKWGPDPLMAAYDPTMILSCYDLRRTPEPAPLAHCAGFWTARGFERVVLHVPGLVERGEYLTFLVKRERELTCPGLTR
ncbi:MAG: hypothetical protein R3B06_05525 [Kofleriaceae bacterium]